MACIDQHQFCNPNNYQCTEFTSSALSVTQAGSIGMNSVQDVIVGRLSLQLALISTYGNIGGRGGSALRAQELVHDLQSDPIPNDQWMVEVGYWFNTGLAKLQRAMVEFASGPANVIDGAHVQKPPGIIAESLCHSQMVHSPSGTISFSILGLALVLVIGSILILTYLILDTVVGYFQKKKHIGRHRRLKWILDENLQLQRLAYEAAEMGNWSGGTAAVPVTKPGETFELPSNIDQDHPKLQYSRIAGASVTVHELSEEENAFSRTEIRTA